MVAEEGGIDVGGRNRGIAPSIDPQHMLELPLPRRDGQPSRIGRLGVLRRNERIADKEIAQLRMHSGTRVGARRRIGKYNA